MQAKIDVSKYSNMQDKWPANSPLDNDGAYFFLCSNLNCEETENMEFTITAIYNQCALLRAFIK